MLLAYWRKLLFTDRIFVSPPILRGTRYTISKRYVCKLDHEDLTRGLSAQRNKLCVS
jgi:hypothetical protein